MMNRWYRLGAAIVAMIMIANLQYAWTLFVRPLTSAHGWKLSSVQWGFTLFIAFETWGMPVSGWLIDRLGPRAFMSFAGVLCGVGWGGLGYARTLTELYVLYSVAGFGAALVYSGSVSMGLKWFADKRGLASGLIAAGFGAGAALFVPGISQMLRVRGYQPVFLYTGIAQGLLIVCAAQLLQNPAPGALASANSATPSRAQVRRQKEDFNSLEMLRTPHFYFLYAMMLMMGIGGLMVTAQVAPVANSFKIGAAVLTAAVTLNLIANGSGRIFWGWVSDHLGRERTMSIAFFLQSVSLVSVMTLGRRSPTLFIACLAMVFFTWGEIFALFPSASADFFGTRNASSNYSFLYSSKGVASIVAGGIAAWLYEKTGTWNTVFYGSAALAFCASLMAFWLRAIPLPTKQTQAPPKEEQPQPQPPRAMAAKA